ncbi:MAG: ribosome recycling factor [Pseudomonadota bacterium]
MISDLKKDLQTRMLKSIDTFANALKKIRTGRAHPSLLENVMVDYYGTPTPITQIANVGVEEGRTLVVTPWEKKIIPDVERALRMSDLGLNPSSTGELIRVPLPSLTEETRREMTKVARQEAEHARVTVRNIRRDANQTLKEWLKEKEIAEDEERKGTEMVQQLTDQFIQKIDAALADKERDMMTL